MLCVGTGVPAIVRVLRLILSIQPVWSDMLPNIGIFATLQTRRTHFTTSSESLRRDLSKLTEKYKHRDRSSQYGTQTLESLNT